MPVWIEVVCHGLFFVCRMSRASLLRAVLSDSLSPHSVRPECGFVSVALNFFADLWIAAGISLPTLRPPMPTDAT